ncbi:hypothetical protein DH2020_042096 [Rehmannia glutinosa]|uniref:RING-CH-type domain-containing protein n=1 Tax=Rehmannia glutinosa TaxID=99300 RepID=A0ABR0UNK3_REHGL
MNNSIISETVIAVEANDFGDTSSKSNETTPNDVVIKIEREDKCCRICHLSANESGKSLVEVMEIGCGCKGELGVAHLYCAKAWFRVKGNRLCEICGEAAKNITGVGDNGFLELWNERRSVDGTSDDSRRWMRGQPLCNLLMACLVTRSFTFWVAGDDGYDDNKNHNSCVINSCSGHDFF